MTVSSRLDWNPAAKRCLQHCGCSSNKRMVIEILLTKTCQVQVVGDKHTHTHTHTFNGPFSGTTRVGRYQTGKTNLDFTEARDS